MGNLDADTRMPHRFEILIAPFWGEVKYGVTGATKDKVRLASLAPGPTSFLGRQPFLVAHMTRARTHACALCYSLRGLTRMIVGWCVNVGVDLVYAVLQGYTLFVLQRKPGQS